ncbi:MAG: FHA domain-containing protein [Desertimonas sp.]
MSEPSTTPTGDQESTSDATAPSTASPSTKPGLAIVGDGGTMHHLVGRAIVGRDPSPSKVHDADETITIDDASGSVTKSHALLAFDDGRLYVTDLGSANGTTIVGDQGPRVVGTTTRHEVYLGERIQLGDRWIKADAGLPSAPPTSSHERPAGMSSASTTATPDQRPPRPNRKQRRRRRRLLTLAVLIPVAVGVGFVLRGQLADASPAPLPGLARLTDDQPPAWTAEVDGRVFSQVSLEGDVVVAAQGTDDAATTITRFAPDGEEVWSADIGRPATPIEAITSSAVLVKLADDGETRLLRGLDVETGNTLWEFDATYSLVQVHDDRVWLLAPTSARVVDTEAGIISELVGDTVAIVGDAVMVLRDGDVEIYDRQTLDRQLGPTSLENGTTSVTFDGEHVYSTDGTTIVEYDDDGQSREVAGIEAETTGGVRAVGGSLLLVPEPSRGFHLLGVTDGRARTLWRTDSISGIIEADDETLILVPDGDVLEVRRPNDGASVARLPGGALRPGDGYVVAVGADEIAAYSLDTGDLEWTLDHDGQPTVTLAERALVLTRVADDLDSTTIEFYA